MVISGLTLPAELVELGSSRTLAKSCGSWKLVVPRDAFGRPLETELAVLYVNPEEILRATEALPCEFVPDGYYGESLPDLAGPGAIPDILDFAKVLCIGAAGDGAPFCLDYRESLSQPSVIWWNDVYWRVVAPSLGAFLALFDIPG